jgi:hypothetical protein
MADDNEPHFLFLAVSVLVEEITKQHDSLLLLKK